MRIGIDARELFGRPTGVGRYLAGLLAAWSALPKARHHEFVLYDPAVPGLSSDMRPPLPDGARRVPVQGGTGSWFEQIRLPLAMWRTPPDVLFAPAYSCPLAVRIPVVVTIHDLAFLAHPEWFPARERLRRTWLTKASARAAACVLTDSEFSKREIVRLVGVPADRIRVVPLAVSPPSLPEGAREPLVLFVGSIFRRRHLSDLIQAFRLVTVSSPSARLEIVGDDRSHPPEDLAAITAAAGIADRVRIRSYVTDRDLADLYARARAFAFLSEYEGFGLTPLEATACGVPAVVLDTPVAREVYGGAAAYVQGGDIEGAAHAILALLSDTQVRAAVLREAPGVLQRYSWERTATETLAALESARHSADEPAPPANRKRQELAR
jgi:glycosyltransferase involved in cell wall biosynthesis